MSSSTNNESQWKYLPFALMGILAAGGVAASFPQAFADITNNVNHMLTHIYNFVDGIEAKTNNLPADPASNSQVNTRATQTSVDAISTKLEIIKCNSGIIRPHVDLSGCDLSGSSDLSGANLAGAKLSGANLGSTNLENAVLGQADLSGASLLASNLDDANLSLANLENADLRFAILSRAHFINADLTNADLSNSNLTDANFDGAIIAGATFTGCIGAPVGMPAGGALLPTCS